MSFRQLRKTGTPAERIKDLSDRLQRFESERGVEDVELTDQGRLDFDNLLFTDTYIIDENAVSDGDNLAYSDTYTTLKQTSGLFQITNDSGGGAGVTQPGIIHFSNIG